MTFKYKLFNITKNIISPSKFEIDGSKNEKIIQALIRAGSDPNIAHNLEHHFNFDNPTSLSRLTTKGKYLGYYVDGISYSNEHGIDVKSITC